MFNLQALHLFLFVDAYKKSLKALGNFEFKDKVNLKLVDFSKLTAIASIIMWFCLNVSVSTISQIQVHLNPDVDGLQAVIANVKAMTNFGYTDKTNPMH